MRNLEFRIENKELKVADSATKFSILNSQFLICAAVLVFTVLTAGISRAEGELQFNFKPGDKYFLTSVNEYKTSQVVDGNELVTEQTNRLECDLDIDDVDETGGAWAKYTYRRAVMKAQGPAISLDFDSAVNSPRVQIQAIPAGAAVGESFYIRITPQGRISKINGLAGLISSAKGKVPVNLAGRNVILDSIEEQYSEAAIRRTLEEQFVIFPDVNAVTDGRQPAVWSQSEQTVEAGKIPSVRTEKTYMLKDVNDRIAIVDVNLVIVSDPNTGRDVQRGALIRYKVSGRGQGTIEIERATGRIIKNTLNQHIIESSEVSPEGPVLRLPPVSEPVHTYITTTFRMTRRE